MSLEILLLAAEYVDRRGKQAVQHRVIVLTYLRRCELTSFVWKVIWAKLTWHATAAVLPPGQSVYSVQ